MDSLIPKAKQSLNVIQQAFAAKRIDFLDVIYAERTLLEFQLSSEIVSSEIVFANCSPHLARTEKLIGYEVPRDESDASALKTEKPDEGEM
jgi:hypothetical protein